MFLWHEEFRNGITVYIGNCGDGTYFRVMPWKYGDWEAMYHGLLIGDRTYPTKEAAIRACEKYRERMRND